MIHTTSEAEHYREITDHRFLLIHSSAVTFHLQTNARKLTHTAFVACCHFPEELCFNQVSVEFISKNICKRAGAVYTALARLQLSISFI